MFTLRLTHKNRSQNPQAIRTPKIYRFLEIRTDHQFSIEPPKLMDGSLYWALVAIQCATPAQLGGEIIENTHKLICLG